jgi:hypothetical protein
MAAKQRNYGNTKLAVFESAIVHGTSIRNGKRSGHADDASARLKKVWMWRIPIRQSSGLRNGEMLGAAK